MEKLTLEEIEALPREYLKAAEAAAILGMSRCSFYKQAADMPFPIYRSGRNYRIPKRPFVEYLRTGQCSRDR